MSYTTKSTIDIYTLGDSGPKLFREFPETTIEIVGKYYAVPGPKGDQQNRGIWIGDINLPKVSHADFVSGISDEDLNDLYIEFKHDHEIYFGGYTRKWKTDGKGGTTAKFRHSSDPAFPNNHDPSN